MELGANDLETDVYDHGTLDLMPSSRPKRASLCP